MISDKNNVINQIQDGLGSEGDRELAERMFDTMRADGRISYDDLCGLTIREDVDLIEVAVEVERSNGVRPDTREDRTMDTTDRRYTDAEYEDMLVGLFTWPSEAEGRAAAREILRESQRADDYVILLRDGTISQLPRLARDDRRIKSQITLARHSVQRAGWSDRVAVVQITPTLSWMPVSLTEAGEAYKLAGLAMDTILVR